MKANELRIGNWVEFPNLLIKQQQIVYIDARKEDTSYIQPIPLTEEWLLKFGFSIINESSAGKKYGYVVNSIFSSDLIIICWKTTKEIGKFFRSNLEIKYVHQLQNLYFALMGEELTLQP